MNPAPHVRILRKDDLAQLVDLCRAHAEYERSEWVEFERESKLERLFFGSEPVYAWVLDAGTELVGYATASFELSTWDAGRYLHLDCLFVDAAYRGHGLGRALVREVARTAIELGAVNVQWQTPSWNERAARFYERLGAVSGEKLRFTLSPECCQALECEAGHADGAI